MYTYGVASLQECLIQILHTYNLHKNTDELIDLHAAYHNSHQLHRSTTTGFINCFSSVYHRSITILINHNCILGYVVQMNSQPLFRLFSKWQWCLIWVQIQGIILTYFIAAYVCSFLQQKCNRIDAYSCQKLLVYQINDNVFLLFVRILKIYLFNTSDTWSLLKIYS